MAGFNDAKINFLLFSTNFLQRKKDERRQQRGNVTK
jgi:hypothetical protein